MGTDQLSPPLRELPLVGDVLTFVGALDLEPTPLGVTPRRLPSWTKPQIPDINMEVVVQMPSGVRMRLATDSTTIEIEVALTLLRLLPRDLRPAVFDLVANGTLVAQQSSTTGNVITVAGPNPSDISFEPGPSTTIRFEGLESGMKTIELWLPQASAVEVRAVRIDADANAVVAPASSTRRWVHYGSSISHCAEADSPTGIWPAVAASAAGVELLNLGLAGQCQLDQFVARTIRDLDVDLISLKVGINIVNGDTMRARTFAPAVHGFLDTVREGQPTTPILLVSPIFCPSAEDRPGPTIAGDDGRYRTVEGLPELRQTCLTLQQIRSLLALIVAQRRQLGDANLHYLNGLSLFGADDADDLPDDLHPNADGYRRIGRRFSTLAFATDGPFGS